MADRGGMFDWIAADPLADTPKSTAKPPFDPSQPFEPARAAAEKPGDQWPGKPVFDPDEYLAATAKPPFDPNRPFTAGDDWIAPREGLPDAPWASRHGGADEWPGTPVNSGGPRPVTDPALLSQLNGTKPPFDPSQPFNALPDAPWVKPTFDPDEYLAKTQSYGSHLISEGKSTFTDIPHEVYEAGRSALSTIGEHLNPFSEAREAERERIRALPIGEGLLATAGQTLGTGRGLAAIPELVASPITGTARSVIGHPYSAITGMPYEQAKEAVDTAMMGLGPGRGVRPVPIPAKPSGPLGVTLSEGQATRDLTAIQREQAALRGQTGTRAQQRAQEFADQQRQELAQARENVAAGLDPLGQVIAESPQEAGELVSQSMQRTAAQRKAMVGQAYESARSFPGEIHAGVFEGIGQKIKGDLSLGPEPVIIDDKLTPFASRAIQDVENNIANLRIQNRADPFGQPAQQRITGVNLAGVDQMRKRLSAFRRDAYASGNAADGRAARAVIDAFDDHIDQAVNGGLFNGDPRAVQAWNDARAAHTDYRSTFTAGKNDPIGRVVERIIGKGNNPAAIPNDVADFMYGSSGVNPSSLNVGVANRVKNILGDRSPEWAAVKQGLFSRLVNAGEGMTEMGLGKIAQRLNRFLNVDGRELSQVLFSPQEAALLRQYANLMRQLEVPQAGANWSNTATFTARALRKIGGTLGMIVGATIGHNVGLPFGMGEAAGAVVAKGIGKLGEMSQARAVAKQMPLTAAAIKQWQRAVVQAQRNNTPPSRAALAVATANLTKSLQSLGFKPPLLMGPSVSPAQEDQSQVPRPPGQHKHGGRVEEKSKFGHHVPPPEHRRIGRTYYTPKGPAIWHGHGWEKIKQPLRVTARPAAGALGPRQLAVLRSLYGQ